MNERITRNFPRPRPAGGSLFAWNTVCIFIRSRSFLTSLNCYIKVRKSLIIQKGFDSLIRVPGAPEGGAAGEKIKTPRGSGAGRWERCRQRLAPRSRQKLLPLYQFSSVRRCSARGANVFRVSIAV